MILVPDSQMLPIYSVVKILNGSSYTLTSVAAYNGISFNNIYEITFSTVNNYFYITDYGASTVVALDSNFTYVRNAFVQDCYGIETFNNSVYVTAYTSGRIYRYDLNLVWLNTYISNITSYYYGIMYNSKTKLIYSCDNYISNLNAFDLSLNRQYSDSYTASGCLAAAALDSNIVFIARWTGWIFVYVNKFYLTGYQICPNSQIYDFILDTTSGTNYLIIACYNEKKIYLYTATGTILTNTNVTLTTFSFPYSIVYVSCFK